MEDIGRVARHRMIREAWRNCWEPRAEADTVISYDADTHG